jgi:hypothetical protein
VKTQSKRKASRATARRKPHTTVLARRDDLDLSLPEKMEQVLIAGDLTPLSAEEKVTYYFKVCRSLGLNPLTRPFEYILFRETENSPPRLQLYARKDCTDQLRKLYGISFVQSTRSTTSQFATVEVKAQNKQGRFDSDIGVVPLTKWKDGKVVQLAGKELANALMRAETKAKRRVTLSICGLGMLDASEIESVEHYSMLTSGGRVIEELPAGGSSGAAQEVARQKLEEHAKTGHLPAQPPAAAASSAPQESESSITESGGLKIVQGQLQRVTEGHTKKGQPFIKLLVSGTEYTLFDDIPFEKPVRGCKSLFVLFATSMNEKVTIPVEEKQSGATLYRNVKAKGRLLIGPAEIEDGVPVIQRGTHEREPGEN